RHAEGRAARHEARRAPDRADRPCAERARSERPRGGAALSHRDDRRRWPRRRAEADCPRRPGAAAQALRRTMAAVPVPIPPADDAPHLLVVDDDRRIRDLLSRFLSTEGYRISTANSAAMARAKLASLSFDLLILDVMMPGETGFEFAKSIRQTSAVPILMLTARDAAASRITGLELGADDYVSKPFEPRELSLRVASILRRAKPAAAPSAESLRFGEFVFHIGRAELRKGDD